VVLLFGEAGVGEGDPDGVAAAAFMRAEWAASHAASFRAVTRYRTALRSGSAPQDAVVAAMATSGRAVVFAGSTAVLSLLGLSPLLAKKKAGTKGVQTAVSGHGRW
jgi:MMPL family